MLFRIYGQAILTLHERHSRLLLPTRPAKPAEVFRNHILHFNCESTCFALITYH